VNAQAKRGLGRVDERWGLEPTEVLTTSYLCGPEGALIVRETGPSFEFPDAEYHVVISPTLVVNGPGRVLAFAQGRLFCDPIDCPVPDQVEVSLWMTTATAGMPAAGDATGGALLPGGASEQFSLTSTFQISAAGTYTYNLLANADRIWSRLDDGVMTLVFLPDPAL
jgi:hypothetical protein